MRVKDLMEAVKEIEPLDFTFTHIGEYIFTDVSDKYPLCSLWEFKQMKRLPHAEYYLTKPIDYSTLKCLVYDVRGVHPDRGNKGL